MEDVVPPPTSTSHDETRPLLPTQSQPDLVDLSGFDNPLNPVNLPPWRKWACASALGAMTFVVAFASAVFSAAIPVTSKEFHVSPETMALGTSLFVFGFATGPILMGPASEVYGRKLPFFVGYVLFILSQIPVALGQDVRTILVFRFLGGVASSVCPAITGGWLADFLLPIERGVAVAIFAATTLVGPGIGAIVGQVLVQSSLGWRWIAWTTMILGVLFGTAGFIVIPETYLPVLEQTHAHQLRWKTRNWALHSKLDERPVSIRDFITRYLTRPLVMLTLEPILFSITLYVSFTFGLIYLLFVVSQLCLSSPVVPVLTSPGLSHQLRATERIRLHKWHSATPVHMPRYHNRWLLRPMVHPHEVQAKGGFWRSARSRRQASAHDCRRSFTCHWPFLVWMDFLTTNKPLAPDCRRRADWNWCASRPAPVACVSD